MATTTSSVENIGMSSDDGMTLGANTTVPVSFYGGTPIAQRTSASQAAVSSTDLGTTDVLAVIALANELRAALVAINMIKGS